MSPDLVSTIIPVHNRPRLLREAVESVLAQNWRALEIVVVDDGSSDETADVLDALARENSGVVRALRIANAGPGAAREAGRLRAQGEFIQYLDSDDLLAPRKFERQVRALRVRPDCGAAYGITRAYALGETPSERPWKRTGERIATMFPSLLVSRWWDTSTPLYRRTLIDRAGPWTTLRSEEDWEYDSRIASPGVKLAYCEAHVSDTRFHPGAMLSRPADPRSALGDRAAARAAIFAHARAAGLDQTIPEMRVFARAAFLLARQCGAAGLAPESAALLALAREASGRPEAWDFRGYRALAGALGWRFAGRLACRLDGLRA